MNSISNIYQKHNLESRGREFLILGNERKNILKKYIGTNLKICDLGSRDGALVEDFVTNNEVWCVDFDQLALDHLAKKYKVKTINLDLNQPDWALPESYFDIVLLSEVLEHLYYPELILEKIAKILKPGGVLLGTVPNAFSLKNRVRLFLAKKQNTPLSDPTHINHFSYHELKLLLSRNFKEVDLLPIIQKKYFWLTKISPNLFSFMLFFVCKVNKK